MNSILTTALLAFCIATAQAETIGGYAGSAPNVELRISIDGLTILGEPDLVKKVATGALPLHPDIIEQNAIPLELGKSLQLKVEMVEPSGIHNDVTTHPATFYEPVGNGTLSVTQQGLVTALPGTRLPKLGQLLVVYNTPDKSGFNYIFFRLKPAVKSSPSR